ncbi:Highly reducing polyketide synthase FUM1 [Cladobotryum mycophilum]|uniref:Highly reducing polyketide synthase FUM1 n=1 Tax=Cladobotryum mycophilum TaxID=491253 RepID=A0ABR0SGX1_9HYPO
MTINESAAAAHKSVGDYAPMPSTIKPTPGYPDEIKKPAIPCPIAICSMAFRLPGGITTEAALWDVLANGKDLRVPIPTSRFSQSGFDDRLGDYKGMNITHGYFLDNDLSGLDLSIFPSIMPGEASHLDPQLRQLIEVTRECLESAGETDYRGKRIACYIGGFSEEWATLAKLEVQDTTMYGVSGIMDLFLANRLSHTFDFKGPSMVIKTGCSASAVALYEACRCIQMGDSDAAIVGGVNLLNGPVFYAALGSGAGVLSADGSSKSFDASADGYGRGEAVNVVFLKKLEDAIRDNNPIQAIIRNIGSNSDGAGGGVFAPDTESQEALIRHVYQTAGLNPADTRYVECHATGTLSGDPAEATAVGRVFGENGVYIGSVKPNVGHSEAASGLTSLIKAVLCLQHRTIAPNIKFNTPNKEIPFEEYRLTVPTAPVPWPDNENLRISVNSFGIGGSNVHVILEAYQNDAVNVNKEQTSSNPQLLLFSASSPTAVSKVAASMLQYYSTHPHCLSNLAYTLAFRREWLQTRSFAVVSQKKGIEANVSPPMKRPDRMPHIVMVFTGQGAQWPMMGKQLLSSEAFRQDLAELDAILQQCVNPPGWSIIDELSKSAEISRVYGSEISQPLCTAIQVGLVNALRRARISPHAVVGHSSGEIAAAYAAGAITKKEAIVLAYYRGLVSSSLPEKPGGMAAIALGAGATSKFLTRDCGVVVAAENSPLSTTISGNLDALRQVVARVNQEQPGVMIRELKVNMAYHSHHMEPLAVTYEQRLLSETGLNYQKPSCTLYSTVTGNKFEQPLDPTYWVDNLLSKVKFSEAIQKLLSERANGNLLFVEVGPHSQLSGPLRQICAHKDAPFQYVPTLVRGEDCAVSLLATFGKLFQYGVNVDVASVVPNVQVPLSDLPPYPWDHDVRHWNEHLMSKLYRFRPYPRHSLLGERVLGTTAIEPVWRATITSSILPWLQDHRVHGSVVFPFAAYISMAGEAIRQLSTSGEIAGYTAKHICVFNPLVLPDDTPVAIATALKPHKLTDSVDSVYFEFTVSSYIDSGDGSKWKKHCSGLVAVCDAHPTPKATGEDSQEFPRKVHHSRWYEALGRAGLAFGKEFTTLSSIEFATVTKSVRAELANCQSRKEFMVDPTAIDGCLQLLTCLQTGGHLYTIGDSSLPTFLEEIRVFPSDAQALHARAWSAEDMDDGNWLDTTLDGKAVLKLKGLRLSKIMNAPDSITDERTRYGAARLAWVPDFEFMDPVELIGPPRLDANAITEIIVLFILDADRRLHNVSVEPTEKHLVQYKLWVHKSREEGHRGKYADVFKDMEKLTQEERNARMQGLFVQLSKQPGTSPFSELTKEIWQNLENLCSGQSSALNFFEGDLLRRFYISVNWHLRRFIKHIADSRPGLRILEVGGGTGSGTEEILNGLIVPGGNPPYEKYVFSDVSSAFSAKAKERFHTMPNMEFRTFDISKSPQAQGFESELGTYDVILALYVVHATPRLKDSLENLRSLLRPDGHLILTENPSGFSSMQHIFGLFPGWWIAEDNREWSPVVDEARWDMELKASGFSGIGWTESGSKNNDDCPFIIGARPAAAATLMSPKVDTIAILSLDHSAKIPQTLSTILNLDGVKVNKVVFGEELGDNALVISTIGIEGESFDFSSHMGKLQELFKTQFQSRIKILWLLHPTEFQCNNSTNSAELLGTITCTNREMDLLGYTLQIRHDESQFNELIKKVLVKVSRKTEKRGIIDPDCHFTVQRGVIMLRRIEPFMLGQEIEEATKSIDPQIVNHALEIESPGKLNTLRWIEKPLQTDSLEDHEVEIELKAFSLNFRDLLSALGLISKDLPIGLDGAGIIRSLGAGVKDFVVGDRVACVIPRGAMSTARVPYAACYKIPDDMSLQEAATIPNVFITALYSLVDVARVTAGQTVLIHSAAGGLGHAALAICKYLKAEVFATVGSEEKVEYLVTKFNIPRNRIFNSRNDSFVDSIMHETNGQGVDIVLNSLSGKLLHASWACVSEFGCMVELGKRDLIDSGSLAMKPFLKNRTYTCVDVGHIGIKRPLLMASVFQRAMRLYCSQRGSIQPIPYEDYPAIQLEQGFRNLQQGAHIGKTVFTMPKDLTELKSTVLVNQLAFDPDGSYLLTGGLGGVGKSIVRWMIERGARNFIFLSPTASSNNHKDFIRELESLKCHSIRISGMAQELSDVKKCLAAARSVIKGYFIWQWHYSWKAAIDPKAGGLYNLHTALIEFNQNPDFLIATSSLSATFGTPGQSNYIAANILVESFCQYRRSQGLPASTLIMSPIADVGYLAEHPELKELQGRLNLCLYEKELLKFIEHAIVNQKRLDRGAQQQHGCFQTWKDEGAVLMGLITPDTPLAESTSLLLWRDSAQMASYHNHNISQSKAFTTSKSGKISEKLRTLLGEVQRNPVILQEEETILRLATEIGKSLFSFMMKDVGNVEDHLNDNFRQMGLDSLVLMELRGWFKEVLQVDISPMDLASKSTLKELGQVVATHLHKKYSST